MGKYMLRKDNVITGEVAVVVMDHFSTSSPNSNLGVRTRPKTLLLQDTSEVTPCSIVLGSEVAGSLDVGSTTPPRNLSIAYRKTQAAPCRNAPSTDELEEFFSGAERLQQKLFTEKYNYDVVNDCPLPGRYEWVDTNGLLQKRRS